MLKKLEVNIDDEEFEIIIKESTTGVLYYFLIFYDHVERRKSYSHVRTIIPKDEFDFLDYLYELTRFWKMSPVADNEYIAEQVKNLIEKNPVKFFNREYPINWEGKFIYNKEQADIQNQNLSRCVYKVTELIAELENSGVNDVTERTIRFYESMGLLPKPEKKGKFKMYSLDSISRVKMIKNLQAAGKTLKEIMSDFEKLQS